MYCCVAKVTSFELAKHEGTKLNSLHLLPDIEQPVYVIDRLSQLLFVRHGSLTSTLHMHKKTPNFEVTKS